MFLKLSRKKKLSNLKELTTLNLSNNKIKEIVTRNLPRLRYLCLDNNLIDLYQINEYNSNLRRIMYFRYLERSIYLGKED